MDAERFRDLATEYLLHGLEGPEREEFEAALRERGEAGRLELDRLRETLAALALDAPPVEPPTSLRSAILADISAPGGEEASGRPAVRPVRASPWLTGVTAVAASIALLVGLWGINLQRDLRRARDDLIAAQQRLAEADSIRDVLTSLQNDIMTVTSPEATTVTLTGTPSRPQARARAFLDPLSGRALLFIYELPIIPPDSVYQLWAISGGTPVDAGTFRVDADLRARLDVTRADDVLGADALAVTVEPAPGVPAPTGPIVLSSSL